MEMRWLSKNGITVANDIVLKVLAQEIDEVEWLIEAGERGIDIQRCSHLSEKHRLIRAVG